MAGCHDACSPVELDISGFWRGPLDLVSVGFAGEPLLAPKSGIQLADHPYPLHVGRKERGLRIRIPGYAGHADNIVATFHPGRPQALISTLHTRLNKADGESTVAGVDGADRAVVTIGKASVLPFVGTRGSMLDLGQALIGSGGSVPETRAVVLARADTPASVLAALRATGAVGAPTTYADALAHLSSSPRAEGTRLYTLVAVFAVLIALVTLASTVAQQTVERRLEAASLRSVGVPRSAIRDGFRREAGLLAAVTFVATLVGSWVTGVALLPALPLVSGWAFAPPLDATPRLVLIAACALVAAALVAASIFLAFRSVRGSSQPRDLREDLT